LSLDERVTIEKMGGCGHSIREIAAYLGRSPSTISREVRRGLFSADAFGTAYKPYRDPRLMDDEARRRRLAAVGAAMKSNPPGSDYWDESAQIDAIGGGVDGL